MFRKFCLILGLSVASLQAQYRTESWNLQPGWNAIYLNVDPGERSLDSLLSAYPSIVEVWQWRPNGLDPALGNADPANERADEWRVWRRGDEDNTTFSLAIANAAYLVRVSDDAGAQNLSLKGKVVMPRVQWRTDGANLVGFPIQSGTTPPLTRYLGNAGVIDSNTSAYRYVGGALSASNPIERPARLVEASRGEAFWIRSDQFTDFYGPISVRVALDDGLSFGTAGSLQRLVLKNNTDEPVTVTLEPTASESAPAISGGLPLPPPPSPILTLRERSETTGLFEYPAFGASQTVSIPPNGTTGLSLGLDRAAMSGGVGQKFAGLLKVTDDRGLTEIYVPMTAERNSLAGLWVGEARISRVQNQLQRFQRGPDGQTLSDDQGNFLPEYRLDAGGNQILDGEGLPIPVVDQELNATAQEFKIRLLVHLNESGTATLLSRVYAGIIADDGQGTTLTGLSTYEDRILPVHLDTAVRLSSSHFPSDLKEAMTGSFSPGSQLSVTVDLGANHSSNPFLHTYHPDHDNKDARFENTEPDGIESHKVERAITFTFNAAAGPGEGPQWGNTLLSGTFTEAVTGLHKEIIRVSGIFSLGKVSDISTLHTQD